MRLKQEYQSKIYAGVLGKMVGVYLGRPVEGWPYHQIEERFGEVTNYVHEALCLPLIVADDDISGTFAFFRALEDNGCSPNLTARQIGDSWLNYIIENRTILWWGGLGNSTEHTAYLNLKRGIPAPRSGSIAQNGRVLAEQIGAQIFMDAYAMACPGDPELAVHLVRQAAGVSHDGVAVDAACFLAAMEASAFDERDLNRLFDANERFIQQDELRRAVADTREACAKYNDWRAVRAWLDEHYGYALYQGPCHMIPNHTMVLASLLMGGDDFRRSVTIAASAAWDTDCNAGNAGCLNGIRLGIEAIEPAYRGPVADRAYVITADGGEGISDAVREARRIISAACRLSGCDECAPAARFAFEQKGSVQGFEPCPFFGMASAPLCNANESGGENGLMLSVENTSCYVSVATFLNPREAFPNYETFVSPTLYSGQTVTVKIFCRDSGGHYPAAAPYLWYARSEPQLLRGETQQLHAGENTLCWLVPDTGGMPVCRFGVALEGTGSAVISSVDWANTPVLFAQNGILMQDMWDLSPFWAKAFVSSAQCFAPNLNHTYCISHHEANGLATIGTRDFTDYTVSSTLLASLHSQCGLVARAAGHRRYYAAVLRGHNTLAIIKRKDSMETTLCSMPFTYTEFTPYELRFTLCANRLELAVGGKPLLACEDTDNPYFCGGTGFLVNSGAMFIDDFTIAAANTFSPALRN